MFKVYITEHNFALQIYICVEIYQIFVNKSVQDENGFASLQLQVSFTNETSENDLSVLITFKNVISLMLKIT